MSDSSNSENAEESFSPELQKALEDLKKVARRLKKDPHLSPFRRWLNTIGGLTIGGFLLFLGIMLWSAEAHVKPQHLAFIAGSMFCGLLASIFGLTAALTGCDPIVWWTDSSLRKNHLPNLALISVATIGILVSSLRIWGILTGGDNLTQRNALDMFALVFNALLFFASVFLLFLKPILSWWLMRKIQKLNKSKSKMAE